MTDKRQLRAIMFTDIVGYTAMMGESEAQALEVLGKSRELHRTLIATFRGEYLEEFGDGNLASFESAVDAVGCALEIQHSIRDDPDLNLRIGIHMGDVIARGGRIIGDAVNVASRIEPLAATGGICVSGNVHDGIRNKPGVDGIFLGAKSFKNVSEPVRVYGLTGQGLPPPEEIRKAAEKVPSVHKGGFSAKKKLAAVVLALAAAAGLWYGGQRSKMTVETASAERMALPLPDEPSIVVLPFANLSGDPHQDFLCDGLTEDIITGLAKVPGLFVIARNSSFTYKGGPVKVQQVSEELGVRYVMEGSLRRIGNRVRISAQLIDALSGGHVWAETYDRDVGDVFAMIDEITMAVMNVLQAKVTNRPSSEFTPYWTRGTKNLKAYEKFIQGLEFYRQWNREANLQSRHLFEEALTLDPDYPVAMALLADTYQREIGFGPEQDKKKLWQQSMELSMKAMALDETLPHPHSLQSYLLTLARKYDEAIAKAELAVSLAPGSAVYNGMVGFILQYAGRTEEAVLLVDRALRLDPYPSAFLLLIAGMTYRTAGYYNRAIEVCRKAVSMEPNFILGYSVLASAYSLSGRDGEARDAVAEVLRINPQFSLGIVKVHSYKNPADLERIVASLRRAGLPDRGEAHQALRPTSSKSQ